MPFAPVLRAAALAVCALLASLAQAQTPPATSTRPLACADFNAHVNGSWESRTELPPDRARIGSFDQLRVANDRLLESALQELVAEPARQTTPGLQRLAAYYRSGMDQAAIEARGLASLAPVLAQMDGLTRDTLPRVLGQLSRLQVGQPLALFVGTDAKDATRHVLTARQSGLGLPDRDDYLKDDDTTRRLKAGYRSYMRTLLQASGTPLDAAALDAALDAVLALEAQIARAHMDPVQRRDPQAQYNPHTLDSLATLAPGFAWRDWFAAYTGSASDPGTVVLAQPEVARALARLAQDTPLPTWRHYLRVRVLDQYASGLPQVFEQARFAYRSGVISGLQKPPSRAERVIALIGGPNGSAPMGEAMGELYVSKAHSPQAQRRALQMVEDIRAAAAQRIGALPWMGDATKAAALAKLNAMVAQIGRPERWRSYDGLVIEPDDLVGNQLRVDTWWTQQRLADLGRPVDRTRWNTSANTVNAFAAGGNRIVFPAGILQPPFFDEQADDATNYGAIGSIIGHEITHHFDDRGRQYDSVGNLRDWWQPADAAAYKARAERVAQLYSGYEPLPGVRINGHQMLGENISDFGGIQMAYAALQIALKRQAQQGRPQPLVEGQTPEQRFFTANAVVWRGKMREQALLNQLRTGQHSPGRYRVLGPISNMAAFATAFGCQKGDAMVAADPIVIW
jgi:predicted metalloendopeptidase